MTRSPGVRAGFTLVETLLFLGILSIMSGAIVGVFLSTQEARVRQNSIANIEQQGTLALSHLTKTVRRAETVLLPESGSTGSLLLLQMAANSEFPTIVAKSGSGLMLVQKSETSALLNSAVRISDLVFRNVGNGNVWFTFKLTTTIPIIPPQTYARTFNATATLFPDDQGDGGGCGSCPLPACISHAYTWYVCESGVCSQSDTTFPC